MKEIYHYDLPEKIILYQEFNGRNINLNTVKEYIKGYLPGIEVSVRPSIIDSYLEGLSGHKREELLHELATSFSKIKIKDPFKKELNVSPLRGEIDYEIGRMAQKETYGVVYDGVEYQGILRGLILREELSLKFLHIFYIDQLIATWGGIRYHLRVGVYGIPNIVSIHGPKNALGIERRVHVMRSLALSVNPTMNPDNIYLNPENGYIRDKDPRLEELLKGYTMQAFFYHLMGEPFCDDKDCRLYNAHWQKDALRAQSEEIHDLCPYHMNIIKKINEL